MRLYAGSHPAYILEFSCENEEEAVSDPEMAVYDVFKYRDYYLARMLNVWKDNTPVVKFDFLGEGPATAIYVCEDFVNGNNSLDKEEMWEKLRCSDLNYDDEDEPGVSRQEEEDWITRVVVDDGSNSTVNPIITLRIYVNTLLTPDLQNIHVQAIFYEEGKPASSQSQYAPGWLQGRYFHSHNRHASSNTHHGIHIT